MFKLCTLLAGIASVGFTQDIPPGPSTSLPDHTGTSAVARPLANSRVPQNPFMAPNTFSHVHFDPWMSDTTDLAGPLDRDPVLASSTLQAARDPDKVGLPGAWLFNCVTVMFDSHGRLLLGCAGMNDEESIVLADPLTFEVLSTYTLKPATGEFPILGTGEQKFIHTMAVCYSFLDNRDQVTTTTDGNKIIVLREGGSAAHPVLEKAGEYDLDGSDVKKAIGVIVDWRGRIWFATKDPAKIYVINPAVYENVGDLQSILLDDSGDDSEGIRNTFAMTKEGAAYVVTTKRLYRVEAGADDKPYIVWSEAYKTVPDKPSGDEHYQLGVKKGQYEYGSGTTPTILGEGKYVAITDNAQPMHVVVYRTEYPLRPPQEKRVVCEVPVFENQPGGASSNSLIGSGLSLIAENTYGYYYAWAPPSLQRPNSPGFERVDILPNGKDCYKVWTNNEVASTVSARLSTKTGLIYTFGRKSDPENAGVYGYYWTAIDFRTGKTVWEKLAGAGDMFSTYYETFYPGLGVGPSGGLYLGVFGGMVSIRDTH